MKWRSLKMTNDIQQKQQEIKYKAVPKNVQMMNIIENIILEHDWGRFAILYSLPFVNLGSYMATQISSVINKFYKTIF